MGDSNGYLDTSANERQLTDKSDHIGNYVSMEHEQQQDRLVDGLVPRTSWARFRKVS